MTVSSNTKLDMVDKVFERLTVVCRADYNTKDRKALWWCRCSCGRKELIPISGKRLRTGKVKSCGCLQREITTKKNAERVKPMVGRHFGRLKVIREVEPTYNPSLGKDGKQLLDKFGKPKWHKQANYECECKCGAIVVRPVQYLTTGDTKSCGCYRRDKQPTVRFLHGLSHNRVWGIHYNMIDRCYNSSSIQYDRYGGRGITICSDWYTPGDTVTGFTNFFNWAIMHGYEDKLTIDRIDNNGNYSPDNCRWVTMRMQANNTSKSLKHEYNGKTHTLSEWSDITGLDIKFLADRINTNKHKWTIQAALNAKAGYMYHKGRLYDDEGFERLIPLKKNF